MKKYSLVIASNFLDHYQLSLSNELKKYFDNFYYIVSEKLEDEYKKLGFTELNNNEFVIKAYENKEQARKEILDADIVLTGSYLYKNHLYERQKLNKPIIFYSERLFKYNSILNFASGIVNRYRHRFSKNSSLLCVSAYSAQDYNSIGLFKGKTYKWGYFPETMKYDDIDSLIKNKIRNSIFWAGRLIEWKHPDYVIKVAKRLKDEKINFVLKIAGNGKMEEELKKMIEDYKLEDCVFLLGSMSPEQIRKHMEESEIYLFTSDKGEGWGVVLNEAMNSACACVASYSAGSTPFLIDDNVNGLIYKNDSINSLYEKTKMLLNDSEKRKIMKNAYNTITNEWSSQIAAERLYNFSVNILEKNSLGVYNTGILSKGDIAHE